MDELNTVRKYFNEGYNCTQAILMAFSEDDHIEREPLLKLTMGLGAGLGYQGKICGAVLGAYMVISLKFGSSKPGDKLSQNNLFRLSRKFDEIFKSKHKSLICNDILGTSLTSPQEYHIAEKKGVFNDTCINLVEGTVRILQDLQKGNYHE